ncbi:Rv2732c family membrane protein [Lentzea sp. E54]|uniref:Rv2732c family membrane protein n=1 Tax=Lentzea xerophila TaxID=3435883 RepID=UPI003DA3E0A4
MSDEDFLRKEIDAVEHQAAKRIDPGTGALTISIAVLALLVSLVLPWIGEHSGLRVVLGESELFLPRLFSYFALGVGVLGSGITLAVRRWGLAWVCSLGLFAGSIIGVLSIWTQQTTTSNKTVGPGPGIGLVIAVVAVIVLLVKWVKIAASRPPQL